MALFESYERRIDKINAVLNSYGISSIEEAEKITKDAGLDVYDQVKKIQPICFENACWAYIVGAAIAIKKGCKTAADAAAVAECGKNVAMQIAALKPQYTSDSEVSAEYIEHEKEILMAQIQNDPKESQKPAKVIEGMITGRIKKELKEICLLDQVYVKAEDGKQSVSAYVASVAKENNANIKIKGFVRFETGEGIEKKNEDFAAEVAAQLK